jgi:hypothetical protein
MWNNFQKVLEGRVNKQQNLKKDKHLILGLAEEVVKSLFGEVGKQNIEIVDFEEGNLFLKMESSVWRSEVKLRSGEITKKINSKLKQKAVGKIIVK